MGPRPGQVRYIPTSTFAPAGTGPGSFYTLNVQHPEYQSYSFSPVPSPTPPTHPQGTHLLPHYHRFSPFPPPQVSTPKSDLDAPPAAVTISHATPRHQVPPSIQHAKRRARVIYRPKTHCEDLSGFLREMVALLFIIWHDIRLRVDILGKPEERRTNTCLGNVRDVIYPLQQCRSAIGRGPPRDVHRVVRRSDIEYRRRKIDIQQPLPVAESVWRALTRRAQCLFSTSKVDVCISFQSCALTTQPSRLQKFVRAAREIRVGSPPIQSTRDGLCEPLNLDTVRVSSLRIPLEVAGSRGFPNSRASPKETGNMLYRRSFARSMRRVCPPTVIGTR